MQEPSKKGLPRPNVAEQWERLEPTNLNWPVRGMDTVYVYRPFLVNDSSGLQTMYHETGPDCLLPQAIFSYQSWGSWYEGRWFNAVSPF